MWTVFVHFNLINMTSTFTQTLSDAAKCSICKQRIHSCQKKTKNKKKTPPINPSVHLHLSKLHRQVPLEIRPRVSSTDLRAEGKLLKQKSTASTANISKSVDPDVRSLCSSRLHPDSQVMWRGDCVDSTAFFFVVAEERRWPGPTHVIKANYNSCLDTSDNVYEEVHQGCYST